MAELNCTTLLNDTNLKAYYRFEVLTTDSKGSYTLTNNNSVGQATGEFTQAADFGSANTNKNLKRTADDIGLTVTSAQSYAFWIKLDHEVTATEGDQWFFTKTFEGAGTYGYAMTAYEYNGGTKRIRFSFPGTAAIYYTVTLGTTWHHIVIASNGTNSNKLYVDGSNVATDTTALAGGTYGFESKVLCLGGYSIETGSYSHPFSGLIDDFSVWNKQLSATEVTKLYSGSCDVSGGAILLNFFN